MWNQYQEHIEKVQKYFKIKLYNSKLPMEQRSRQKGSLWKIFCTQLIWK